MAVHPMCDTCVTHRGVTVLNMRNTCVTMQVLVALQQAGVAGAHLAGLY
jgi:hypothetical protein